jgi:hypothetical protein
MLGEDTIEEAFTKAKAAQFRGVHTIDVVCDALNRRHKPIVFPFYGCPGFVRARIKDDDDYIVQLIVRVDVADILITAREHYLRSLNPEQPKFKKRAKPRSIMSR